MARPIKQGLDYFPLDVDIDQDDKISMIEALHGHVGFSVVIKLLAKIYKEGYFYEWSEREQILFSKRVNVDINILRNIVDDCIKERIFNKTVFEGHGVLTSKGIQKRYLEAVKRRKQVVFMKKYFLVDDVDAIIGSNKISVLLEYEDEKRVNVNINHHSEGENADISTQRKGKERKGKNINIKPSTPKIQKFTMEDMANAKMMFDLMLNNNAGTKQPNLDKWAEEFRLIREKDRRTDEQIKYILEWSQNDSFWKSNILSPSKLRKQWNQLVLKIKAEHDKQKQLAVGHQSNNGDIWGGVELE